MEVKEKSPSEIFDKDSISLLTDQEEFLKFAKSKFKENDNEAFYIADMARILESYLKFKKNLPKCEIFYAMKCLPDPNILKLLTFLNCGIDAASKDEIEYAQSVTNCPSEKIIFSHPQKFIDHLQFARKRNIKKMTFDCVEELEKIKIHFPEAELILRIKADSTKSTINLSLKFGAEKEKVAEILKKCKDLELNFVGVSFHVGTGSYDTLPFKYAISDAASVFDQANEMGFKPFILDIGGGFPGIDTAVPSFEDYAITINSSIETYFANYPNLSIIAEPGRFFAQNCYYLFANIIAKKFWKNCENFENSENFEKINKIISQYNLSDLKSKNKPSYVINDSVALSLSGAYYEQTNFLPKIIENNQRKFYESDIYGYCNNPKELVSHDVLLPNLELNEYIYFENSGSYTSSVGENMNVNGYTIPSKVYYCWIENEVLKEKSPNVYEVVTKNMTRLSDDS